LGWQENIRFKEAIKLSTIMTQIAYHTRKSHQWIPQNIKIKNLMQNYGMKYLNIFFKCNVNLLNYENGRQSIINMNLFFLIHLVEVDVNERVNT
jgi:hypothetical protein